MGVDYYGVLGLSKHCNDLDIKEAFRRYSVLYNPERQNDPALYETFCLIAEAYDILSQPKVKAIYDQYGEEGLKKGIPSFDAFTPPYVFHGNPLRTYREFFGTTSPYADLLDLLDQPQPLFQFSEGQGIKKKEPPVVRPLFLTLYEVFHGATKKMKIQHRVFVDDSQAHTEIVEKILTIPIKPGLPPCTEITFKELGEHGHTIIPGDVIFVTEDLPHEKYHRHGVDLKVTISVDLKDSLIGTNITLETLDYRKLHIPITQVITPQYTKVIKGEGMPFVDDPNQRGNLIISFNVIFPFYLPKSSKITIQKAMAEAKRSGADGSPDHIQLLVHLDKLQRTKK